MKGIVKKLKVTAPSKIKAGKSTKLKAVVTASAGANKALTFTSSNTKYMTVSSKGVAKALKAGKGKTVKITRRNRWQWQKSNSFRQGILERMVHYEKE